MFVPLSKMVMNDPDIDNILRAACSILTNYGIDNNINYVWPRVVRIRFTKYHAVISHTKGGVIFISTEARNSQ